ncbi:hypothetical protein HanRHA438_Chr17g0805671 [Helianthus annuus]|nr:hypothetical protein HanRHA438_Chr17g0805671 [Helianthus annuus]
MNNQRFDLAYFGIWVRIRASILRILSDCIPIKGRTRIPYFVMLQSYTSLTPSVGD